MGASLYGGFSALTFGYFMIRYYLKIGETPTMNEKIKEFGLLFIFFIILVICVIFIPGTDYQKIFYENNCSSKEISKITGFIFIYWIFLFLFGAVLLMFLPGWVSPFSNTFGYSFIYLMGKMKEVDKFVLTLMDKANHNDKMKKDRIKCLLTDRSLFLNEITPYSLDNYIEMEIGDTKLETLLNTPGFKDHTYKNNMKYDNNLKEIIDNFKKLLNIKESVGIFIWYILLGFTTIMLTSNIVRQSKCEKNVKEINNSKNDIKSPVSQII